jgi:hypothetical protein
MMVRIKQNYKLIPEKSLVGLAVSQYDADTVEFVQERRGGGRVGKAADGDGNGSEGSGTKGDLP